MTAQELQQLRGLLAQTPIDLADDPAAVRTTFSEVIGGLPVAPGPDFRDREVGGVPGLWTDGDRDAVLLYLHGGGYVIGSAADYRGLAGELARAAGVDLFSVDYRLAPENPFPAATDDALAAYRGLLETGVAAEDIIVAGDSAGGGLALALLVALRDAGTPLPAAALLLSPWVDLTLSGESVRSQAGIDPSLTARGLAVCAARYVGDDTGNPLASPLFADLRGLPPLIVHVGEAEILLDDAIRLARAAAVSGVDVTVRIWQGMIHDWALFACALSEGRDLIDEAAALLSAHLDGGRP